MLFNVFIKRLVGNSYWMGELMHVVLNIVKKLYLSRAVVATERKVQVNFLQPKPNFKGAFPNLRILVLILAIISATNAYANHILGGSITYTCLGGDQYQVDLNVYIDCFGATNPPAIENIFFFPDCGAPFSVAADLTSLTEISDLCVSELPNSSCSDGFAPGTWLAVYSEVVTLSLDCPWSVYWESGDWNYFVNVNNAGFPTAHIETIIDLSDGQCNSSASVSSLGVPYVCMGEAVSYQVTFDNPSGYTLDISLTNVLTDGGVSVLYEAGYSGAVPIPGISLNPATGLITFNAPMQIGSFSVGILIEQYDGLGNFVGSVLESMAFVVTPCIVAPTIFAVPEIQTIAEDGVQTADDELELCAGDSVCFTVSASNLNIFRSITLSSDFTTIFPNATFEVTGTNPAVATLCMYADPAMIGSHVITIDASDDDCVNPSSDQIQITLNILNSLQTASLTETICLDDDVQLNVTGANTYTWTAVSGEAISVPANFSCNNCGNPVVSPSVNTVYQVVGNGVVAACNQRDTIEVFVALSGLSTIVVNESCLGNDGSINLSVPNGSGNYSYAWSGPNGFSAITQDINGLDGGQYDLLIEDLGLPGCQTNLSVTINSTPPPTGDLLNSNITICAGDCVNLEFDLTGTGPFDLNLTGTTDQVNVNDGHILQVCPLTTTTYTFDSVTDNNLPACTTNIAESVTVTVLPDVTASFLVNTAICEGDDINLVLDISQAGNYNITYNDGVNTFTVNNATDGQLINVTPAATTTYTITEVAYTSNPACPNAQSNAAQVVVNDNPTASLLGNTSICAGGSATLTFDLTGNGPFDVTWTDGVNTFNETNIADGYTVNVSPLATTEYCITEVQDASNPVCVQLVNSCVDVTVFALPTGTLSQNDVICEGEQVSITFNLIGQQPFDLEYTINGAAPIAFDNQVSGATLNFNPLVDTEYCLISITDSNNPACTANVNSCVDITVNPLPTADITGNDAICAGDCIDIPLTLTGTGPFTIEWEIEDLTTGITTTQADILGAVNGDFINFCFNNPSIVRITGVADSAIPACNAAVNSEFEVSVQDVSDVVFAADGSFCENGPLTLSFTFTQPAGGPWDITIEDALGNPTNFNGIVPADLTGNVFETTVNPTQSTTYTIVAFVDASYPCSSFSGSANVSLVPLPTGVIGPDQFFCPGDDIFLELQLPAPGTFDVTYSDGVNQFDLFAISDGYTFQVNPLVTTTYSFVNVTELASGIACSSAPADVAVITVDDIPQISPADTLCDATGDFYQISFEISGGDPLTYDVTETGIGPGVISAGPPYIYTSAPIPSGSGATFEIDDANPCIPIELEIQPYSCPVLTDAGTMDLTVLNVCENEAAIAIWNNDGFLDGNDELMFVLHNNPGESLGLVFALDCNDAGFNDADTPLNFGNGVGQIQYGVTYYITAVAGNDDGTNDCVDLNNPNISVAAGTPVIFYEEPTVVISGGGIICEGSTIDLQLDFSGQGPWTFVYAIDGVDQPQITTPDNPYVLTVDTSGDYTITSLSNEFCTGTSIGLVNVLVNPVPDAQIAAGGLICQGETFDLTIDFTGTGPWDFELIFEDGINPASITPFNTAISPFVIAVANEGTYSVANVIDATNCLNPDVLSSEFLEVTAAPTASMADEVINICEGESYDIVIALTGSASWDLIYTIDGVQQPTLNSAVNEITITATQAGVYELFEITDLTGCTGAIAGEVTLDITPLPVANAGPDIVVCSQIDAVLGAPFVPGLGYLWDDPQGLLSSDVIAQPVFNEINASQVAQVYNFTLTVASGNCQAQDDVQITLESEPIADAGADQTICYEAVAQLNAQGGVSCSWTADPTLDDPAICNPTASPLVNTTYTVTVQAANGCEAIDEVLIEVTDPLVIDTLLITEQICFQTCDGELSLSADGTFGAATFDWVFPDGSLAQGDAFSDLCPGDYNITLTDDLGCNLAIGITLTELPEYVIQSALSPAAVCFEESNGVIDVLSPEAVQFELSPGEIAIPDGAGAYQYTGLEAGIYELTATDAFGCTDVLDVEVLSFPQINYNTGFTQTEICWEDNVSFTANANGGGGGFTFYWLDENGLEFGTGSPLNFVPTEETTLFGYVLDANNCSSDTIAVSVVFPNPLTIELDPSETAFICEGDEITIAAELGGGVGFPAPVWTTLSNGQQISNQTSFTDIPEDDEGYVVTVTDGCAVPVTDTVFVVVQDTPEVLISYDAFEGCAPVEVQLINLTDENLVGSCLWQFGDGNILAACVDTVNYLFANPGEFTVSLTVTSPDGCVGFGEMDAEVEVYPYPVANFTWTPNPPSNLENVIQFINQTQGGNTFFWDFDYLGTSPSPNPILELPAVDFGFFPVCLTATNIYGCTDSICENVVLQGVQLIYVPNAFTPDGDGRNDVFLPVVSGIDRDDYVFRIFDRWGQKIFETEKTDEPWLGNINGGDHYVQNDVYVWQIITKDLITGESKDYVGHVTIVR